jgi:predicted ester cyclase
MTTSTSTLAALHADAIERFNAGDLDGYLDLYAEDVVFGGVTPAPLDRAGARAFHQDVLAAFPGAQARVLERAEAGDRLAVRLVLEVEHRGEFMGLAPTGRRAALAITTILRFAGGRCVERWSTADMLGLLLQLGATVGR